jgi:DNA-binding IclR family transcriptional regulator
MKQPNLTSLPAPDKPVGALVSGLSVLRYLAGTSVPVGVTRIARDLDLHSSTCFNLLKTLVHERLVNFDDSNKTYTIGLGVVELAKGALEQSIAGPHDRPLTGSRSCGPGSPKRP